MKFGTLRKTVGKSRRENYIHDKKQLLSENVQVARSEQFALNCVVFHFVDHETKTIFQSISGDYCLGRYL